MNSRMIDLNHYLYFVMKYKSTKLVDKLDDIDKLVEMYLSYEKKNTDNICLSNININDGFNLVYKFLNEKYPDKAYLFSNILDIDNCIFVTSNEDIREINNLIYERLLFYLKRNSPSISVNLLEKELKNSNINKYNYIDFLKIIRTNMNELKNSFFSKSLLKYKISQKLKELNSIEYESLLFRNNNNYILKIINRNNVCSVTSILHEYIHKDNYIIIREDNDKDILEKDAFLYLSELPSIVLECEFTNWLYDNRYITLDDYKYTTYKRLNSTFNCAISLKAVKIILDIYRKNNIVTKKLIIKELTRYSNINYELLNNIKCMDYCIDDMKKISLRISYLNSTILTPTILKRMKNNPNYRNNLLKVNDNLMTLSYKEALDILNIDYDNKEILDEIYTNYIEYINILNKTKIKIK